jgi:cobalt-zinc-cadmium efflux system outer membrane protein
MNSQKYIAAGLVAMGVVCLSVPTLWAQSARPVFHLSRQQAIQEALDRNPSIAAAREQVAEAKAGITIATALPDPSLVTEIDQERDFVSPGTGTERDVGIQFTVPFPLRNRLNGRIARGSWQAAQFALTQLQQQIASQTAQAYDAAQVAARHREDLTQSKEISAQFLDKAQKRFLAGTVPKLDTVKAKVDLAKAENALIANGRLIATTRSSLNHLLGRAMDVALEELDPLYVPATVPDVNTLSQLAAASRPELRSMRVQRKAAHDSTTVAKQYWAPDLNLTLWRSKIDGAPNSYKFDGGITFPLFFWQHKKGQVEQAVHHEQELNATEQDLFSQVMLDVQNSHATANTTWQQAVFLRDQLLPEAHEEFDVALKSYTLGGSSSLDLLDAKNTLIDAESQYTDALGAVNDAVADLERAVGAPLLNAIAGSSHEK